MRIHHLAFRTDDVDRLVSFYQTALSLHIVRDARPRSVWLGIGEARLMIEQREASEPIVAADSLELVAFAVDEATRRALRSRLVESGQLESETDHTLYFRDPDRRRIAVSSYPFD